MKLYAIANTLYRLEGANLVKAGKVAPGQMSLFDSGWDESKHPRDHGKFTSKGESESTVTVDSGGHKERVHAAMSAHRGHVDRLVEDHKKRMDGMTLSQLHDHAPDVEYDEYHTNSIGALDDQIKAATDPSDHDQIDQHFDDAYSEQNMLGYSDHVAELERHHGDRIFELEKKVAGIHNEHIQGFDDFVAAATDPDANETLEQWHTNKDRLTQQYKDTLRAGVRALNEIGALRDDVDSFMEAMHDSYEEAIDEYSDDPEDWEDDESGDDYEGEIYDRLYGEFDTLVEAIKKADIPTFEKWQAVKQKITTKYESLVEQAKKEFDESGADQDEIDSLMDDLQSTHEEALDLYSSDPEDWEDWNPDE